MLFVGKLTLLPLQVILQFKALRILHNGIGIRNRWNKFFGLYYVWVLMNPIKQLKLRPTRQFLLHISISHHFCCVYFIFFDVSTLLDHRSRPLADVLQLFIFPGKRFYWVQLVVRLNAAALEHVRRQATVSLVLTLSLLLNSVTGIIHLLFNGALPVVRETVFVIFVVRGLDGILLTRLQIVGSFWRYVELANFKTIHIKTILYLLPFLHEAGIEFRCRFYTWCALRAINTTLAQANRKMVALELDCASRALEGIVKLVVHFIVCPRRFLYPYLLNWLADRIKPLRLLINFFLFWWLKGLVRRVLRQDLEGFGRPQISSIHRSFPILFLLNTIGIYFESVRRLKSIILLILFLHAAIAGSSAEQIEERLAAFLCKARTKKAVCLKKRASAWITFYFGLVLVLFLILTVFNFNRINIS